MCCGCKSMSFRAWKVTVVVFALLDLANAAFCVMGSYVIPTLWTMWQPWASITLAVQMTICAALSIASVATTKHSNMWVPRGLAIANLVFSILLLIDGIIPGAIASGVQWSVWFGQNCLSNLSNPQCPVDAGFMFTQL